MEQIEERKSRPSSVVKNDDPPAKVEEQNTYAADSGGEEDGGQGDIAKNFTQLEIDTFNSTVFVEVDTFAGGSADAGVGYTTTSSYTSTASSY